MYFLLQSCSGHSSNTGDTAHGEVVLLHFLLEICTFSPVIGLTILCVPVLLFAKLLIFGLFTLLEFITLPLVLLLVLPLPPLIGEEDSSFDFRFSGRGGKKATGDVEGVFELTLVLVLLDEFPVAVVVVAVVFVEFVESAVVVVVRLPRPFAPPFRNLLCIELRVSVKLLRSLTGNNAEPRLRFARPFGVRESNSSVGESQNRGGAQSCFVQSIRVPT